MGYVMVKSLILTIFVAAGFFVLAGCKSSTSGFALPKERTGFFSKIRTEERSRKWGERRAQWQRNEDKKAELMLERMKGRP